MYLQVSLIILHSGRLECAIRSYMVLKTRVGTDQAILICDIKKWNRIGYNKNKYL